MSTVLLLSAASARGATPSFADAGFGERVREAMRVAEFTLDEIELPAPGALPEEFQAAVRRDGRTRVLRLSRHSVRSDGFRLLVQGAGGALVESPAPPPSTYRGVVEGLPGSLVAASLLPEGLHAMVLESSGEAWSVRPLRRVEPGAARATHVIFAASEEEPLGCGAEAERLLEGAAVSAAGVSVDGVSVGGVPVGGVPVDGDSLAGGGAGAPSTCTLTAAEVAFDSDYEFFEDDCESDPDTCAAIIETGLNITDMLYIRDLKVTYVLTAALIRSDPAADFYAQFPDASDFGAMLSAFRSEWNANMGAVDYDAAYLLTGKSRPEYGGLAYVGVVCTSSRYGMGIGGWGYEGIFRHEVGHNWGAGHSCGAERRYIMCGNSISAISAYNIRVMSAHRDSRDCLDQVTYDGGEPAPPYIRLDRAIIEEGSGPVAIDVVRGDTDINCDVLRLAGHDATSAFGASLYPVDDIDPDGPLSILYVPRSDLVGTDYFRYDVRDQDGFETSGAVLVEVMPAGGLVVYLKLDETDGTDAFDASGNGHDGEMRGELSFVTASVPGRYGSAVKLSAVSGEYISLGDDSDFDLRRELTVAVWFRVDAFAGDSELLVGKGASAWRLERDGTSSRLRFTATGLTVGGDPDGDLAGTVPVDDGAWHHAAAVYDGSRTYLYIDGELDASLPASGLIDTNSDSVHIGDDWNGVIDEVRLYSYGLSAGEVLALYLDSRLEDARPADGATSFVPGSALTWTPAPSATAHDVYFGTDRDAVAAATTASAEYAGRMADPSFVPDVAPGSVYFWRVDEVAGAVARRGAVRTFATSFAYTGFDEPPADAASFTPGPGDVELGFGTESTPTAGDSPYVGVVDTSSTPTTPILSHRSVDATTTFAPVDLSERGRVLASLILQARDTGYEEEEDFLEVYATSGAERIDLLRLEGGNALTQRAGTGYATFAASLPAEWDEASLVIRSSSNSSSASERYDFDSIGFSCHELFSVIAYSAFAEPAPGAVSYAPGPGARELGFATAWAPSSGIDPLVGVVEIGSPVSARLFSHRSANATTTFETVDLSGRSAVRATVVLRVRETGYEASDFIEVYATDGGGARVDLVDVSGDTGLNGLADGDYASYWAEIPDSWSQATLVVSSASNSSAAAERYDIRLVEIESRALGEPCAPPPPVGTEFLRGDANGDGKVDLSDGVRVLNYLFLGNATIECLDAADSNDTGGHDLTDGVRIFNFLFLGHEPPPVPGHLDCGVDPSADSLSCDEGCS